MAGRYISPTGFRRTAHGRAHLAVISVFCLAWLGSPAAAIIPDWEPPEPAPEAWDWIKMSSGEWLKGEVHDLNDDKLAFESDELDDLDLDWGDVAELRSPRILTYTFDKAGIFTGTAVMKDGTIAIRSGDQYYGFRI